MVFGALINLKMNPRPFRVREATRARARNHKHNQLRLHMQSETSVDVEARTPAKRMLVACLVSAQRCQWHIPTCGLGAATQPGTARRALAGVLPGRCRVYRLPGCRGQGSNIVNKQY